MFRLIRKLFKAILVLTGIMSFIRCNSGYKKEGDKVFFNGKEVSKDLEVLSNVFAKDKTTAYYKTYSISDADIATFTALDDHYAKDKNQAYYCDEYRDAQSYYTTKKNTIIKIRTSDPSSFSALSSGYAKDNSSAFFQGQKFTVNNIASLEVINLRFIKDKSQVYFEREAVNGSRPESFEVIDYHYAKDAAHIYYYGLQSEVPSGVYVITENTSPFVILKYPYSKNETAVFYLYTKINNADPKTISVLGYGFSKDAQNVFYESKKIEGVDAATFTVFTDDNSTEINPFAKDKSNIYYENKKVNDADVSSFKVLSRNYAVDQKHVFHKNALLKNADPKTFKVYPYEMDEADAEDTVSRYLEGKKAAWN